MELLTICRVINKDQYEHVEVGDTVLVIDVLEKDAKIVAGGQNILAVNAGVKDLSINSIGDEDSLWFYEEDLEVVGNRETDEFWEDTLKKVKGSQDTTEEISELLSEMVSQFVESSQWEEGDLDEIQFEEEKTYVSKKPSERGRIEAGEKLKFVKPARLLKYDDGYDYMFIREGEVLSMENADFFREEDVEEA